MPRHSSLFTPHSSNGEYGFHTPNDCFPSKHIKIDVTSCFFLSFRLFSTWPTRLMRNLWNNVWFPYLFLALPTLYNSTCLNAAYVAIIHSVCCVCVMCRDDRDTIYVSLNKFCDYSLLVLRCLNDAKIKFLLLSSHCTRTIFFFRWPNLCFHCDDEFSCLCIISCGWKMENQCSVEAHTWWWLQLYDKIIDLFRVRKIRC